MPIAVNLAPQQANEVDQAFMKNLAHMVAMELAETMKPYVRQVVEDAMPGQGLNQGQLSDKLKLGTNTDAFKRLAYEVGMPRYQSGDDGAAKRKTNDRWYSKAVDEFMKTYSEF